MQPLASTEISSCRYWPYLAELVSTYARPSVPKAAKTFCGCWARGRSGGDVGPAEDALLADEAQDARQAVAPRADELSAIGGSQISIPGELQQSGLGPPAIQFLHEGLIGLHLPDPWVDLYGAETQEFKNRRRVVL